MNKYFITCNNHIFCGMETHYTAYAENKEEFLDVVDMWAHDNFVDLGGYDDFNENDPESDYIEDELDEAPYAKVEEFEEEIHGKWEWFEVAYDGREK